MVPFRHIGTHHRQQNGVPLVEFDVFIEGVEYRCDDIQFDRLCKGVPLDELDMRRLDEVDDD